MKSILNFESIFLFNEDKGKYFYASFGNRLNVIYGKNTSGKSTLVQLIFYAFGINDNKIKLKEILEEDITVRLDITISYGEPLKRSFVFIRQSDTLFVQTATGKIIRFNGIGSDNSAEHVKLKSFIGEIFDFNLKLESTSGMVGAPIEAMFLPYYVSQEVGWVYLRKSFGNFNFYRNFKEDYLDHYLGIESYSDRDEKRKLEKKIIKIKQEISFFTNFSIDNSEINTSVAVESGMTDHGNSLIENLSSRRGDLLKIENDYVKYVNQLTYLTERLAVVSKVRRNHKKQEPGRDKCPTCSQNLPLNLSEVYEYLQEENDTIKILSTIKDKIKSTQSKVNSLYKSAEIVRSEVNEIQKTYSKYSEFNLTFDTWVNNKANLALSTKIKVDVGQLILDLEREKDKLRNYKTQDEVYEARKEKSKVFKGYYLPYTLELGLTQLDDSRYYSLYDISSFPYQGVQLHLSVLAYHFAFNNSILTNPDIHRFPFILDSIFKEDIDGGNRTRILKFICKYMPIDTQTIISIADDKNHESKIEEYKSEIFDKNTNFIKIGGGTEKKALLGEYDNTYDEILQSTVEIIEKI